MNHIKPPARLIYSRLWFTAHLFFIAALCGHAAGSGTVLTGNWTTFGNGPAHSGYFPGVLGSSSFTPRWTANAAATPSAGSINQVVVAGNRIFVTGYGESMFLTALTTSSGLPL